MSSLSSFGASDTSVTHLDSGAGLVKIASKTNKAEIELWARFLKANVYMAFLAARKKKNYESVYLALAARHPEHGIQRACCPLPR